MKILLVILGILALLCGSYFLRNSSNVDQFEQYKLEWGKRYLTGEIEQYRRIIFNENVARILAHNATPGVEYTEGINQFTDLTAEEFISTYLGLIPGPRNGPYHIMSGDNAADIDWQEKGAISEVKDQGQCGSCWAFSANGAMEPLNFLYGSKKMELFSEQMLVDCSKSYGNHGCQGGLMTSAYKYIHDKGIKLQSEYPYVAKDQTCKFPDGGQFTISGHKEIRQGACEDMLDALQKQPIAVAVDASKFSAYTGGIFSNCGTRLNHGVTLTAFKKADGFYRIKNSWGLRWGEKGYMRIKYPGSTCGICNMSCYPEGPKWK